MTKRRLILVHILRLAALILFALTAFSMTFFLFQMSVPGIALVMAGAASLCLALALALDHVLKNNKEGVYDQKG